MTTKTLEKERDAVAERATAAARQLRRKARRSAATARDAAADLAGELREPIRALGGFARRHPLETATLALAGAWLARLMLTRSSRA